MPFVERVSGTLRSYHDIGQFSIYMSVYTCIYIYIYVCVYVYLVQEAGVGWRPQEGLRV